MMLPSTVLKSQSLLQAAIHRVLMQVREKQVSAVLGAGNYEI